MRCNLSKAKAMEADCDLVGQVKKAMKMNPRCGYRVAHLWVTKIGLNFLGLEGQRLVLLCACQKAMSNKSKYAMTYDL